MKKEERAEEGRVVVDFVSSDGGGMKRDAENERKICEECKANACIYQCPRCNFRSCSLACCVAHKQRTGCTGKRDRTAYLPLCRMSDDTLRNDYFFLEEALNQMPRNRKRSKIEIAAERNVHHHHHHNNNNRNNPIVTHSKKVRRLIQQAEKRGIELQIMPPVMERHKTNKSWYCPSRDMITWKLEVIIYQNQHDDDPQSKEKGTSISFQISENESNIMDHIATQCKKKSISLPMDTQLFLKRLPSNAKHPRYVHVQKMQDTLKTLLKDRTIIEYPTIHCVPSEMVYRFPIGTEKIVDVSAETGTGTTTNSLGCS